MGKTYNNDINNDGHVHDLLSSYIDKSIEEDERVRVRAHLEECADCRADYVELQATRRMLQQMPAVAVPRAFTLTPDMVKDARKTSFWERVFAPRTAPTFASGAVVAFGLLLFLVITSQLSVQPSNNTSIVYYSAPDASNEARVRIKPTETPADQPPISAAANAPEPTAAPGESASKLMATPPPPGGMTGDTASEPPLPAPSSDASGAAGSAPDAEPIITPNTEIAGSGNSSPTTTTLYTDTQAGEDNIADNTAGGAQDTTAAATEPATLVAQAPIVTRFDFIQAVEIGLLVIGLALGGAFLIARRR